MLREEQTHIFDSCQTYVDVELGADLDERHPSKRRNRHLKCRLQEFKCYDPYISHRARSILWRKRVTGTR